MSNVSQQIALALGGQQAVQKLRQEVSRKQQKERVEYILDQVVQKAQELQKKQQVGGNANSHKLAKKNFGDIVSRNGKKYQVVKATKKQAAIFGPKVLKRI